MKTENPKLAHRGGCSCCPRTEDVLSLDTVLYWEFGGYEVLKDGEVFYRQSGPKAKTLAEIEKKIEKTNCKEGTRWLVILDRPLRGATWERKEPGRWILIDTNPGFA